MQKWLVVARNEYRIRTSRIRRIRAYFPYIVVGILAIYVVFITPSLSSLFIDDVLALLLSQVAPVAVKIILFTIFVYFIIIPITDTLRQEKTKQVEIFLAAPMKPSDVLLGEFLGEMPLYVIFVTVVTGPLIAFLSYLGLDMIQIVITVIIFVVTFFSAFWIGTVLAAVLRTRLGESSRGRDMGRALAMIIALPLVALIYAMQFGGFLEALADPSLGGIPRFILNLLPSSWGGEVVVGFIASPGNIQAVGLQTLLGLSGLLLFSLGIIWLGMKVADRAYSLEPTEFTASRAKPDGVFYNSVKFLGGRGSFSVILTSTFKDFGRRLENLSNMIYVIGLLLLMNIFIIPNISYNSAGSSVSLMVTQFIFPILVVMVAGDVTVQDKETLFIYRKAPSGVKRLVKARLVHSLLVVLPIVGVITLVTAFLNTQLTLISAITATGLTVFATASSVAFALGLFLLNPPFSAKSVKLGVNLMLVMALSVGLFLVSMALLAVSGLQLDSMTSVQYAQLLHTALGWLVGAVFLHLGRLKLERIE